MSSVARQYAAPTAKYTEKQLQPRRRSRGHCDNGRRRLRLIRPDVVHGHGLKISVSRAGRSDRPKWVPCHACSLVPSPPPDEVRIFPHGSGKLRKLDEAVIGRAVYEPGWRWTTAMPQIAGTTTCELHHLGYSVSGLMHVVRTT